MNLKGRGDFVSIFVLDLTPGAQTTPQKHCSRKWSTCSSGHGSTTVESSDGRKHTFEWGPKSLFALPLNARYQHFNVSGREHARLASTNNFCMMLNLFHNEHFVFDNPLRVSRAPGLAEVVQRRRRLHPGRGRAATCGRPISSPTLPPSS